MARRRRSASTSDAGGTASPDVTSLPRVVEVVLAERLEVVQQAIHHRCARRRDTALVPCPVVEAVEQGLPGGGGLAAGLRALAGAREHHDGDRGGDRLRGYLGRLLQVRVAGGQFLGGYIWHYAPMLAADRRRSSGGAPAAAVGAPRSGAISAIIAPRARRGDPGRAKE